MMELSSIARRREVWIAMADLFLDTDIRLHYAYVARVAAGSDFTFDELEAIFRDEVAPVLEFNLFDIAGEWAMFDEEWLTGAISAHLGDGPAERYEMRSAAMEDWRAAAHLAARLRALPPEERERRGRLWTKLSALFLNRNPPPPKDWAETGYTPEELDWIFREEMMPSYGRALDGWRKHNAGLYPSLEELEARWKQWLEAAIR